MCAGRRGRPRNARRALRARTKAEQERRKGANLQEKAARRARPVSMHAHWQPAGRQALRAAAAAGSPARADACGASYHKDPLVLSKHQVLRLRDRHGTCRRRAAAAALFWSARTKRMFLAGCAGGALAQEESFK
jgi:hypothetical protein